MGTSWQRRVGALMLSRRSFLGTPVALIFAQGTGPRAINLQSLERARVLRVADRYLGEGPLTVTASSSPRSAGGRHDYFSEGDYWWPDPQNPDGPYIQRDGLTNPDNFVAHRHALIRLSLHVPALTGAWLLTKDRGYAAHAARHLRAWFIDETTRMNPHLLYAQAIKGRVTGRGIGIIDTLHLAEVVRAVTVLEDGEALSAADRAGTRAWFERYLEWMTTHEYGIAERDARNNHGTCWVLQVAEFARYTGRADLIAFCRERFKTVLVPNQIAPDGSFPEELRRTKPYGYSLFNLDALATVCQTLDPVNVSGAGVRPPPPVAQLSGARLRRDLAEARRIDPRATAENPGSVFRARSAAIGRKVDAGPGPDLWRFETLDGRGIGKALAFMFPFIADKRKWPHKPDVMYFDDWPVRHVALLWGGMALDRPEYVALWRTLDPDPTVDEVIRNYFIRQPVLWS